MQKQRQLPKAEARKVADGGPQIIPKGKVNLTFMTLGGEPILNSIVDENASWRDIATHLFSTKPQYAPVAPMIQGERPTNPDIVHIKDLQDNIVHVVFRPPSPVP